MPYVRTGRVANRIFNPNGRKKSMEGTENTAQSGAFFAPGAHGPTYPEDEHFPRSASQASVDSYYQSRCYCPYIACCPYNSCRAISSLVLIVGGLAIAIFGAYTASHNHESAWDFSSKWTICTLSGIVGGFAGMCCFMSLPRGTFMSPCSKEVLEA